MIKMTKDEAYGVLLALNAGWEKLDTTNEKHREALRTAMGSLIEPHFIAMREKKGHWEWKLADNGWADHICSECGYTENTDIHVSLGWSFCPKCGADMRQDDQSHPFADDVMMKGEEDDKKIQKKANSN